MAKGAFFEEIDLYVCMESSDGKLLRIYLTSEPPEEESDAMAGIIDAICGRSEPPEMEMDPSRMTRFTRRVYEAVRAIPRGETRTYAEVAEEVGSPGAARAVGNAMARNPFPLLIPCHRVLARSGLGGYGFGLDVKRKLLELEKV